MFRRSSSLLDMLRNQTDLYLVDMCQPHTEGERGYLEDTYNLQGILIHLFHLIPKHSNSLPDK